MHRSSLTDMAGRIMHHAVRLTMNKANDNPMMQELSFDGMVKEGRKIVERMQTFGMSAMPLPRDEKDGGGGEGNQKGPAAEGIALFLGGQRNHPVVIGVDDRRHRPMGLKPGESAQYDHQGQMTLIREAGMFMLSLDDDGEGTAPGGKMLRDAEGRATGKSEKKERMVSLRHVAKKKQDRDKGGSPEANLKSWADAGVDLRKLTPEERAEKERAPNHEDYKHEGETVNTEVRCTKNRIEFRSGDKVVGYYDVEKDEWQHKAKSIKNEADSISHKGVHYFDSDIHVAKSVYAMNGLKPGNGDWGSGSPSSGPSGDPVAMPPDIAAYVARKQAQADALEDRLARLEARIAELEAR